MAMVMSTVHLKGISHDKVVLEVIVRELKELSKNYPDYVRLKEETK